MIINDKPNHIEDYLVSLHSGQWFGWSDVKNKIYTNLIILDDTKSKPSESDCTSGLATMQSEYDTAKTNAANKKASGKQKLKDLGLDDDEINAFTGA
jgi:hypothetical protein